MFRLAAVAASRRAVLRQAAASGGRAQLHTSQASLAYSKFAMPAMSPTMTEGGIASWKKNEGDTFAAGDVLLEIETDKATMDVEAQDDGILAKIIVQGGSKNVPVGSAIAVMGEEGDSASGADLDKAVKEAQADDANTTSSESQEAKAEESEPKKEESNPPAASPPKEESTKSEPKKEESSSSAQPEQRDHVFASPVAKRLAQDRGIALSKIKGTGPNGRIIKADVENYKPAAESASASASTSAPAKSGSAPPPSSSKLPPGSPPAKEMTVPQAYTDIPASNMRKVIASRLTESKQSTPHYYLTAEVKMDRVMKLREVFNKAAAQASDKATKEGVKGGMKLSVNDFVVKAASVALRDVPEANSAWMGDFIRQYAKADIAIAVATPNGLITPIVTDVGGKGLATISSNIKSLAAKAKDNKLQPAEYQGGSFTISNLGMYGIESFTAIINPPQSCILAVGATEQKLVLDETSEKGFKVENVMKVTLSADHRTVDGAVGARWMSSFKEALENPLSFML